MPIGANVQADGSTHFRVWAPDPADVHLVIEPRSGGHAGASRDLSLAREADGYYSVVVPGTGVGDRYRYRLDGTLAGDPASRFQPEGPFGPSEIVDPDRFAWTDAGWGGVTLPGHVVYEMHIGTFTGPGTWRAAMERLPDLVRTGVTLIEVMPIAEFPGGFGWGYDGVFPFAPVRAYGTPDDVRRFIDRSHALGVGVILDVVYNHFGPAGCVHRTYAAAYFARQHDNEWGDGLNFDGPGSAPVREYFAANAAHWIDEYHFDGLRLDATQSIHDQSETHLIALLAERARSAAGDRSIVLVAENERQEARLCRPAETGGYGLDALWNDDFHHTAIVALTGRREAYYSDHAGTPQELISAARHGFLFQGQRYAWQKAPRGTRTDGLPPRAFVVFLENHDQVANSGDGSRLWRKTSPGRYRAMTALLLLLPATPMLFQGQEFGSSAPFLYFADHEPELAAAVQKGRAEFVRQFPSLASPAVQARLPLPHQRETFERCKLDWTEFESDNPYRRLHADLIALRKRDPAFSAQNPVDGAVLAAETFVLRFKGASADDERLLVVNLGSDLTRAAFPEPLLGPPSDRLWTTLWSSEHPDYGGMGVSDIVTGAGWSIPGHSGHVLKPTESIDAGERTARG
jgi:maltooligosyltrehalose trehalohydrolase